MSRASTHAGIFFFLVALLALPLAQAQTAGAKKFPIKIIYSALTASNAPVWVAGDQGLYDKYGLDVQIVHGRGASPIQALAGGTVELGHFAGASVIAANLAGSDLVFVAAQSNYVVLSMWTKKDSPVKNLADLAGKISVSARQARRLIRSRASRSGRLASLRKTLNSSITAPYRISLCRWTKV